MDCEFFPCWEWFNGFMKQEQVTLEQHENFVRTSYRNRAYVAGANGLICLSVPLAGGRNQRTLMKDVKIDYTENWQAQHWKSIESAYRRSPYFEYFEDGVKQFYETRFDYLVAANVATLELILDLLQLKKEIVLSTEYVETPRQDFRSSFLPKDRTQTTQPPYIQPFSDRNGFLENLSMLDFLFCEGRWG